MNDLEPQTKGIPLIAVYIVVNGITHDLALQKADVSALGEWLENRFPSGLPIGRPITEVRLKSVEPEQN